MKALSLLAVLLAALAASACRKQVKPAGTPPPDWDKTRESAGRAHDALDQEGGDR